jgi:acyl carrier protein
MGCTYPVPRDRAVTTTYVGRPFDNVVVRVLDGAGNVLPAGIVGEIHFAGHGVTQGYLNRAELTAEKFVSLGGRRFYRTGDRGRLSEDGWLEILGRNDFQTKLRGMRVELGEVEHQLRRAPGVRDAVATAREGADHEKVLVAYVVTDASNGAVAQSDKPTRIGAIRRYMLDHLPDYMVPAVYVELDRLPVNHNLKIDRRALPAPGEADLRAASGRSVREPQTATERKLSSFWQQLLGVQQVGLDDNFFELGGHSMLAVLLSLEVEQAFGIRLEGMDILREPLEVLAAICDRHLGVSSSGADGRAPAVVARDQVEIFHFGEGQSLYGVLRGSASSTVSSAALICAPVGQEHVRTHFVLTRLAKQLARDGVPTLMFDYFGCGDSLGDSRAADWDRWRSNIAEAHAELQRRAKGAPVTAIGVRLGGSLLCQAASDLDIARLVLWDPVCEGAEHSAELARMQRAYLRSIAQLRFWKWRRTRPPGNELLGTTFSDAAFRELKAFVLAPLLAERRVPIRWLATSRLAGEEPLFRSIAASEGCRVECLDHDCGWRDLARLEDVLPDVRISSTLRAMVLEG